MPGTGSTITLIFPHTSVTDMAASATCQLLIARGTELANPVWGERSSLDTWQRQLLAALALSHHNHASAPLTWRGLMQAEPDQTRLHEVWLQVDAVHLALSIDGLTLHPVPGWTAAEAALLERPLRELAERAGFHWHSAATHERSQFFLTTAALEVDTVAPAVAAQSVLRHSQPQGRDAQRLRKLSTEFEMSLHEQSILAARTLHGGLTPNSVWIWGAGVQPTQPNASQRQLPPCWTETPYARGLYDAYGQKCEAPCTSLHAIVERARHRDAIAMVTPTDAGDAERSWFAPLRLALRAGSWQRAQLCFSDASIAISRRQLWQFWRNRI